MNGADPVPNVPPAGMTVNLFKFLFRIPEVFGLSWGKWIVRKLIRVQDYRHYGDQRFLTICSPGDRNTFPDVRILNGVSVPERIWRSVRAVQEGTWHNGVRVDKYHQVSVYRAKLRSCAKKREQSI